MQDGRSFYLYPSGKSNGSSDIVCFGSKVLLGAANGWGLFPSPGWLKGNCPAATSFFTLLKPSLNASCLPDRYMSITRISSSLSLLLVTLSSVSTKAFLRSADGFVWPLAFKKSAVQSSNASALAFVRALSANSFSFVRTVTKCCSSSQEIG